MARGRRKSRELSRSKRKKEGRKPAAMAPRHTVENAAPQAVAPSPPTVPEAAPLTHRPAAAAGRTIDLVAELKRVGMLAAVIVAVLVALALLLR